MPQFFSFVLQFIQNPDIQQQVILFLPMCTTLPSMKMSSYRIMLPVHQSPSKSFTVLQSPRLTQICLAAADTNKTRYTFSKLLGSVFNIAVVLHYKFAFTTFIQLKIIIYIHLVCPYAREQTSALISEFHLLFSFWLHTDNKYILALAEIS